MLVGTAFASTQEPKIQAHTLFSSLQFRKLNATFPAEVRDSWGRVCFVECPDCLLAERRYGGIS
jgi:hypothetical protein